MPITTKSDDILISFSYEYPMEEKNLKLDFSLLYKEEVLSLRIKSGNRALGTFPVSMFKEIIEFLYSKGHVDSVFNDPSMPSAVGVDQKTTDEVDDLLKMMSSQQDEQNESVIDETGGAEPQPVQSFSVDYKSDIKSSVDDKPEDQDKNDDVVSFKRFRDDINYVESGSVPDGESVESSRKSSIKRS